MMKKLFLVLSAVTLTVMPLSANYVFAQDNSSAPVSSMSSSSLQSLIIQLENDLNQLIHELQAIVGNLHGDNGNGNGDGNENENENEGEDHGVLPMTSGISVSGITTNGATVNWTTNVLANSKVYYSTVFPVDIATAPSFSLAAMVTSHSVALSGLSANTLYYYTVESKDAGGNIARMADASQKFTTLVAPVEPVISGINVSAITTHGAMVNWMTDVLANSKVFYAVGNTINLTTAASVSNAGLVMSHSLNLSGLTSNTTYTYVVESVDTSSNKADSTPQTFHTLSVSED